MIRGTMPDPPASVPHVVIVGGGFGGLTAAKTLRARPSTSRWSTASNHHLFQPLLYQVATAGLSPGDIASPIRWILRRQTNARRAAWPTRSASTSRAGALLADVGADRTTTT